MAKKKKVDHAEEQLQSVEQSLSRAEQYLEENQNMLMYIVGGILLVVAGFLGYQRYYVAPMEEEASREMYFAEMFFEQDSFRLALDGTAQYYGFIDIADEYSATNTGNLANYYAGLCYRGMGDYTSAIEYLDKFNAKDEILAAVSLGAIGDCFMEIDQAEEALEYYEKAANKRDNKFTAPIYLKKAGIAAESLGEFEKAVKMYKKIESEYADSPEARDIEKYIARAEQRAS
jgi:tetratricopeptide (TPR) repeat protein